MYLRRIIALCAAAVLSVSCSSGGGSGGGFGLIEFLESGQNNIPRNRQVRFMFSQPVATGQDLFTRLKIQNVNAVPGDSNFARAQGFYLLNGELVIFTPRLPNNPDRSDAGFREDGLGDAARAVGGGVSKAVGTVAGPAIDKAKDLAGDGLSMNDVKKYGVAGTIAYILTELAFWAVAFPVASTTFYNTAGQWPARTRTLTPNRDPDPGPHPSLTRRATGPTLATEVIARRSSARSSWAPTSRGWLSRCASAWPSPPRRGSTRTSSRGLALQATARPRPHSRSNYAGKSSTVLVSTS